MLNLLEQIAKVLVVVITTGAVVLGAAWVGYQFGESNGKIIGFYDAVDHINGLTTSELCNIK